MAVKLSMKKEAECAFGEVDYINAHGTVHISSLFETRDTRSVMH